MKKVNSKINYYIQLGGAVAIFLNLIIAQPVYGLTIEGNDGEITIENLTITPPIAQTTADTDNLTLSIPTESNITEQGSENNNSSTELDQYTFTTSTTGTLNAFVASTDAWPQNSPDISITINWAFTNTTTEAHATTTLVSEQSGTNATNSDRIKITDSEISATVNQILNYLKTQQSTDGKIIDGTITDWAIMSFGADNQYADEIKNTTDSLLDYEKKYNLDDPTDINSCASYPRHILALLAAGVNKNDIAIIGLKEKIENNCFQNNLYGLNGVNDDIFALLALLALDQDTNNQIIQTTIDSIKSWQLQNGAFSWPDWYDPAQKVAGDDITGAAINALKYAQDKGAQIDSEIFTQATNYLRSTQQTDGGWGYGTSDIMTTSWVLMGINSLGEGQEQWFTASGTNPWYPLIRQLKNNGYYESIWNPGSVDWFAMKHAVPALKEKSWPIILPEKIQNFSQGATFTYGSNSNNLREETPTSTLLNTSTIPTSTLDVATTSTLTTSTLEEESTTTSPADITSSDTYKIKLPIKSYKNTENANQPLKKITSSTTIVAPTTLSTNLNEKGEMIEVVDNNLSIDTEHKNNGKKVLIVSGGGAIALGVYLGLRLLKNMI